MVYRIIALAILLAFYGCYYAKLISQRKKGIQTDQLGRGKQGFVRFIEVGAKISAILVPVAEIISIFLDTHMLPGGARTAGAVIGALGAGVFICSVLTMKDSWRAGVSKSEKTRLVTGGIYAVSRNPAFLGFDLVYAGIALMFFNWVLFALSALAALMLHLQIVNVEEEHLADAFGNEYLDYRKKVCRYFGRRRS